MKLKTLFIAMGLAIASQAPAAAGPVTTDLSPWLEADNGVATDGSSWAGQSGNGHNAMAGQGQAPTYVPSAINGLPVAHFSGARLMAIAGQVITSQRFTIIVVATDESTPQHGDYSDMVSNWTNSTGTRSIFLDTVWKRPGDQGNCHCEYWLGDVAEILVYNKALSPDEFQPTSLI